MSEELKPCPFCGAPAALTDTMPAGAYWCNCTICECEGPASSIDAQAAIKAWNHRAMLASAPTPPASSAGEVITEAMMDAPRPLFLGVIGGGLSKDFTLADHMEAGGWSTAGLDADDLALCRPPTKQHAASMVYRMMRAALASDAGREGGE